MEDSSKVLRPSSNLQDSGPSQLFIDDTRWNNIERNFEHERLKPAIITTSGNVQNLAELRQVMSTELKLDQYSSYFVLSMVK